MNSRLHAIVVARTLAWATIACASTACGGAARVGTGPEGVNSSSAASASSAPTPESSGDLPPPPRSLSPSELAADAACGPFRSQDIATADLPLLDDRLHVRFFPGGAPVGGPESGKIEVKRDGATLFVGARETFLRGDELFDRRAASLATFGGSYEPITIPSKGDKLHIVAGIVHELKGSDDIVALAHGWFLDRNSDVIDVAVFASKSALGDLPSCGRLAEKMLATVDYGGRALSYGTGAEAETKVSYATFHYRLLPDWISTTSMGIHDFARIHFRKRGVFPNGFTELQLALDAYPGDWAPAGKEEGQRAGRVLGLSVTWHLMNDPSSAAAGTGAWTVSKDVANGDHAAAAIQTGSARDRDEAIRFAESVRVTR